MTGHVTQAGTELEPAGKGAKFDADFFAGAIPGAARSMRDVAHHGDHGDPAAAAPTSPDLADPAAKAYMTALRRALDQMAAPDFIVDFMVDHWARVLVLARDHRDPRWASTVMLKVGVLLVMSTQAKSTAAQRDALTRAMPILIQGLEQGMVSIGMTIQDREQFFRQLMPAQAEALRGGSVSAMAVAGAGAGAHSVQQALERILDPQTYQRASLVSS